MKLGAPTYSWFFGPTIYGQIEGFADHVSIILKKCLGDIKSRFLKGFLEGGKWDGPLIVGILFRCGCFHLPQIMMPIWLVLQEWLFPLQTSHPKPHIVFSLGECFCFVLKRNLTYTVDTHQNCQIVKGHRFSKPVFSESISEIFWA